MAAQVESLAALDVSTVPQADDRLEIQSLADSVNALAEQVKALADSNEKLALQLGETPAQPSSPGESSPATSTDSGICSRTPEIQEAILMTLRLSSCRFVTDEELYRITYWKYLSGDRANDIDWVTPPQPGDFAGLVNLRGPIKIEGDFSLVEGTFQGLSGLMYLSIKVNAMDSGVFQGLPSLEHLEVSAGDYFEIDDESTRLLVTLPVFDEMTNLKAMTIRTDRDTTLELRADQFANLPNLEAIEIRGYSDRARFVMPAGLFQHNSALRHVDIEVYGQSAIHVPVDLFGDLHNLERLRIYDSDSDEVSLALSPRSPLFNDLLNRNASPEGYTLVWPDTQ